MQSYTEQHGCRRKLAMKDIITYPVTSRCACRRLCVIRWQEWHAQAEVQASRCGVLRFVLIHWNRLELSEIQLADPGAARAGRDPWLKFRSILNLFVDLWGPPSSSGCESQGEKNVGVNFGYGIQMDAGPIIRPTRKSGIRKCRGPAKTVSSLSKRHCTEPDDNGREEAKLFKTRNPKSSFWDLWFLTWVQIFW